MKAGKNIYLVRNREIIEYKPQNWLSRYQFTFCEIVDRNFWNFFFGQDVDISDKMLMKQLSPRSLKRLKENGTSNNQNQQQQQKEQKTYKVVVIGDCEVGKSGKLKNSFFLTFSFENCNKKIQIWMHLSLFEKI